MRHKSIRRQFGGNQILWINYVQLFICQNNRITNYNEAGHYSFKGFIKLSSL